ncbi:hypothetical protein [Oceanibaculum indicum]|uniref:Uncharacterized protein n=1 Tax=Oceanibaculum indicum P24 TaxID=1207063 RepID=K2K6F5_9PROT|nr:hypothetical protein [Oceanibaculum indicum]EKE78454.1 hypothetical protein P24_02801 [Oceanibaculum indicum P24]
MTAVGKLCPVPGCEGIQKPGKLMCLPHWRRVPKPLKDAVWETWRAYEAAAKDRRSYSDPDRSNEFFVRRRAYRFAADQAVKAVSPPTEGD